VYQLIIAMSRDFQKPRRFTQIAYFGKIAMVDILFLGKYNTDMDAGVSKKMAHSIEKFHLPRYGEMPDMGLYLEQTTRYINSVLEPLGYIEITNSMISNYVKKGLVESPVKKQYNANQIAHLIVIAILKNVVSLENISELFTQQIKIYTDEVAYDYFCQELENMLQFQFGLKSSVDDVGVTSSFEKKMLRSAIIAVSHMIYLNSCFKVLKEKCET